MNLGQFLKEQTGAREAWNCSTMPADYCILLGYPDFAADWRDVTDAAEGERITREAGGLVGLWEQKIAGILPEVTDALAPGDVAVLRHLRFEAGGIWTGERWAIRIRSGLHFASEDQVEVVKAWRP